jgi:hypothetical protein
MTISSNTTEGVASALRPKLGKLDSTKKLEGNKTSNLIILEKPVSIAKMSPAITKIVETHPNSSIKKLVEEFKKYESNIGAKIDAISSSVCKFLQLTKK